MPHKFLFMLIKNLFINFISVFHNFLTWNKSDISLPTYKKFLQKTVWENLAWIASNVLSWFLPKNVPGMPPVILWENQMFFKKFLQGFLLKIFNRLLRKYFQSFFQFFHRFGLKISQNFIQTLLKHFFQKFFQECFEKFLQSFFERFPYEFLQKFHVKFCEVGFYRLLPKAQQELLLKFF